MAGRKRAGKTPPDVTQTYGARVVYDVPTAAVILSLSESTCWRLIRGHKLDSIRVGDRRLVTRYAIDRFLAYMEEAKEIAVESGEEVAD